MSKTILSAGVVVVHQIDGKWQFLLLRAFQYWDFPKGGVEEGEEPLQAAIREVEEETTITDLDFKWGKDYIETAPYNRGRKIARYYIAETLTTRITLPINPELGRPEHNEFRWVTCEDAEALVTQRVHRILLWATKKLDINQSNAEKPDKR
jgi:bis(5'-nucleosidyl)-tetraphosphatase